MPDYIVKTPVKTGPGPDDLAEVGSTITLAKKDGDALVKCGAVEAAKERPPAKAK